MKNTSMNEDVKVPMPIDNRRHFPTLYTLIQKKKKRLWRFNFIRQDPAIRSF